MVGNMRKYTKKFKGNYEFNGDPYSEPVGFRKYNDYDVQSFETQTEEIIEELQSVVIKLNEQLQFLTGKVEGRIPLWFRYCQPGLRQHDSGRNGYGGIRR